MKSKYITVLAFALIPLTATSADSMYCSQKHGYINVGMTENQVIDSCGQPAIKRVSRNPVMINIPMTQLIYSTLNKGAAYPGWTNVYTMWSLPSGSQGVTLQVNIINQKVSGITLNGGSSNAMSICGGVTVQKGDDVGKVYSACGSPDVTNNTYVSTPAPESEKPEVWVYQPNQYETPFSLTFINGKLQSID